jgi:hypothetical protein
MESGIRMGMVWTFGEEKLSLGKTAPYCRMHSLICSSSSGKEYFALLSPSSSESELSCSPSPLHIQWPGLDALQRDKIICGAPIIIVVVPGSLRDKYPIRVQIVDKLLLERSDDHSLQADMLEHRIPCRKLEIQDIFSGLWWKDGVGHDDDSSE